MASEGKFDGGEGTIRPAMSLAEAVANGQKQMVHHLLHVVKVDINAPGPGAWHPRSLVSPALLDSVSHFAGGRVARASAQRLCSRHWPDVSTSLLPVFCSPLLPVLFPPTLSLCSRWYPQEMHEKKEGRGREEEFFVLLWG